MEPIPETTDLSRYLDADEVIDHHHPLVRRTAARLRADAPGPYEYAEAAFGFVRDTIPHSADTGDQRVTWRASDVLEQRTGICHAKAHALTALLRAEGIPAGLCYQKFEVLHGLIALRLPGRARWSRLDPRGNKPGVDARFSLDEERLAWPVRPELGEQDHFVVYPAPLAAVLAALRGASSRQGLALPDELPQRRPGARHLRR
ncbi:Transglutaminase-like superfamily protein [Streptomyces sp. DvalAA-14]|uniref:transglutaminase-like domain-containing protein n=1 Tax=unclassified Streptomyces TaxID=2593676 RepID=UPI00081AF76D|nr:MULTISPECIES: transglutaminase family protein [unclassified Streptomyces]MYS21039.1 transglutaminase [Streptomyces sp. SID4948]SCD82774.1 Transglutaminase-like superfamily protein [Streptomyces sp. DvalAA-14]